MIFGASIPYLLGTLSLIGLSVLLKRHVSRDVSIGLLVWTIGIVAVYQYGKVDQTERAIVALLCLPGCIYLVIKYDHNWLTIFVLLACFAQFCWAIVFDSTAYETEWSAAYAIKYVGNSIFLWCQLATAASLLPWGRIWRTRKT